VFVFKFSSLKPQPPFFIYSVLSARSRFDCVRIFIFKSETRDGLFLSTLFYVLDLGLIVYCILIFKSET
jgi:hypothetical protein